MEHIIFYLFSFIIFIYMLSILFKDSKEKNDNSKLVLKYSKSKQKLLLFCAIAVTVVGVIIGIANKDENGVFIFYIIFGALILLLLYFYFMMKNNVVIIDNDNISYRSSGKNMVKNLTELKSVVYKMADGYILTFNDNSKVKITMLMDNYDKLENYFNSKNITVTGDDGKEKPMGW